MPTHPLQAVVEYARQAAGPMNGPTDADLLRRFLGGGDQDAFAQLVRRHGPMVLGVCHRVLGHGPDADDAFQVAFAQLARRGNALRTPDSLGPWLCRVACRAAQRARAASEARAARTRPLGATLPAPGADPSARAERRELLACLDAEVDRLPEVYRVPVVRCLLQGRCRAEVAREVGCTAVALRVRLTRGLDRLRRRLSRRVPAACAAAAATLLASGARAAVPERLASAAARAAETGATAGGGLLAALARLPASGVVRRAAAVLVSAAALGVGAGPAPAPAAARTPAPAAARPGPRDRRAVLREEVVPRVVQAFGDIAGSARCVAAEFDPSGAARVNLLWDVFPFDRDSSVVKLRLPPDGGRLELSFDYQGRDGLKSIDLDRPIVLYRSPAGSEVVHRFKQLREVEDAFALLRR